MNEKDCLSESALLAEYGTLCTELLQKIELHNTLLNFTTTCCLAVLAFALKSDVPELFLLPLIISAPVSWRISYYKHGMIKLSAYIEVYIEPECAFLRWEGVSGGIARCGTPGDAARMTCRYLELPILGVTSLLLYVNSAAKSAGESMSGFLCASLSFPFQEDGVFLLAGLIALGLLVCGTVDTARTEGDRGFWLGVWRKRKEERRGRSSPLEDGGGRALFEFSSPQDPGQRYTLSLSDLDRAMWCYTAALAIGLLLSTLYLAICPSVSPPEGPRLLWESSASLCGCGVYGIRRLYHLAYRFEKRPVAEGERAMGISAIRRWGALSFLYSRLLVVPAISLFALILIRCGLLPAFSPAGGAAAGGFLMLGIAFLLGLSGGALVNRLIDFGRSGVQGK